MMKLNDGSRQRESNLEIETKLEVVGSQRQSKKKEASIYIYIILTDNTYMIMQIQHILLHMLKWHAYIHDMSTC